MEFFVVPFSSGNLVGCFCSMVMYLKAIDVEEC